ncbi:MAG: RNase adapter RapZ [Desulfobacterium sp.]
MKNTKLFIITGLSGSGKSTVMAALEDTEFYCVDNMPMPLLPKFLELPIQNASGINGFAFVMDMRAGDFLSHYTGIMEELRENGFHAETIFLEADEDILVSRYSQTRRHHPVDHHKTLVASIRSEKNKMLSIRSTADIIIDTSTLNVHQLKAKITALAQEEKSIKSRIKINILSFGFKYGLPREADLVMDMRFLKNPYFVPELKDLDGESRGVKDFVLTTNEAVQFFEKCRSLLDFLIPLYEKEGKAYLTIAIGCTGGRHRSVAIARKLFEYLNQKKKTATITHRDINRDIMKI